MGRALNTPIYNLFGGRFRDRIRVYADCHAGATPEPAAYAERAREVVAAGFTAIKFDLDTRNPFTADISERSPSPPAVVRAVQPHHRHRRAALDGGGRGGGAGGGRAGRPGRHGLPLEVRRQRRAEAGLGSGAVRPALAGGPGAAREHRRPGQGDRQHAQSRSAPARISTASTATAS